MSFVAINLKILIMINNYATYNMRLFESWIYSLWVMLITLVQVLYFPLLFYYSITVSFSPTKYHY